MTNAENPQPPALYGRFSARLRAFYIDVIVILVAVAAGLMLATLPGSQTISRVVGFSLAAFLILLEPILVSTLGSTIGHYFNNLRVVDNRTGGKVSFLKATARMIIKSLLGVYSFVSMLTTSRHQTVHDWVTASTVQIRDRSTARPSDYVRERVELSHPEMPSWYRRVLVIAGYLLVLVVTLGVTQILLVSAACLDRSICSLQEKISLGACNISALVLGLLIIGMGWRGKLYGARLRRTDATQS